MRTKKMEELKESHEAQVREISMGYETKLSQKEEELKIFAEKQKEIDGCKEELMMGTKKMEELQQNHETQVSEIVKNYETKLTQKDEELRKIDEKQREVDCCKEELIMKAKKIEELKENHEVQVREIAKGYEAKLSQKEEELKKVVAMQNEIDCCKEELMTKVNKIRDLEENHERQVREITTEYETKLREITN